jgi:hypothetical protein
MPAADDRHEDIPVSVVVAVTVLILAVLAAIVYLSATGKDVSTVLIVLSSLIAPTIASFVAIHRLGTVQSHVSGVESKVGEKIDNLITDKSNLEQQAVAAGLVPVTATVSFDPESTGPMPIIDTGTLRQSEADYPATQPVPVVRPGRITAAEIIEREGHHGG